MNAPTRGFDPVPASAYPSFQPVTTGPRAMPANWSGVALLHPFSPPLSTDPAPDSPFFQLCVANIAYVAGSYFSAQIAGCSYGTWWYVVTPEGTSLSTNKGDSFAPVEMGWSLPADWFGAQIGHASCAGSSPLNWMPGPRVEWWKLPVNPVPGSPSAATWMWFDSSSGAPVRMMFGIGPPKPTMGDPTQLALFQMFSMTYMPEFAATAPARMPTVWETPTFPGFSVGNPRNFANFSFDSNFGMTAFMTPVNEAYNPLPTRVLYVWKSDADYVLASDRSQSTLMQYSYNQFSGQTIARQVALLTGPAPQGVQPPATSDQGFLINYYSLVDIAPTCLGAGKFPFPQEDPTWVSEPAVKATICATIADNPVVSPGSTVTIFSVLFPPAPPNYPEATYLWTWYAPLDASGKSSRPVTFMQSQSGVGVGTSLALADYFYYHAFEQPIDPSNFAVPACCPV
jgi:hypothetical protein